MVKRTWPLALAALGLAAQVRAEDGSAFKLGMQPQDQSVYALPTPATPEEGVNTGGVNLDIKVTYLTDYIYRGVDRAEALNPTRNTSEDAANFQFDGTLWFNLGKFPHPFIGILANVLEADPVSNFQEVRPFFGAEWRIRPLILAAGNNTYTFPDRGDMDTSEVWGRIALDDAAILRTEEPILSPYIYGAYDYDLYSGWYLEAGVKHDFAIQDTALTLTPVADVAYVVGQGYFAGPTGEDTGFQHYEVGLIARYSLNQFFNVSHRYGQWSVNGYLYYTDGMNNRLRANTEIWGGAGIEFSY